MQAHPIPGAPLRAPVRTRVPTGAQPAAPSSPRINRFMIWLLCSPLHWLASGRFALLSVVGHKTGKVHVFPVQYAQNGQVVTIAGRKMARWWINLTGGADVVLRIRGKQVRGKAALATDEESVSTALRAIYPRSKPERIAARLPWRVAIRVTLCAESDGANPLLQT